MIKCQFEVVKGHGVASGKANDKRFPQGTIACQIPHFKKRGLDLSDMYLGTLNGKLDCKRFNIKQWDHQFTSVKWSDNFPAENFNFCACSIRHQNKTYKAFIYQPAPETKIEHIQPENVVEIISFPIANVSYGDKLTLLIDAQKFEIID